MLLYLLLLPLINLVLLLPSLSASIRPYTNIFCYCTMSNAILVVAAVVGFVADGIADDDVYYLL